MSESFESKGESGQVAPKDHAMRKLFVTLAVLGVGGVGAFLYTDKGRETVHRWMARLQNAPERWDEWNESAQEELENIRAAVNQIAQTLGPRMETGR